ncbi:MAG: hypothetical protein EHM61_24560 [Acidobacteria bacterium]|nr:MAG: hypothetical protein EHM61_24560 [Acidobacteriota bacterium]
MWIKKLLLLALLLVIPVACSRSEAPKEEQQKVEMAPPPPTQPEQQQAQAETPPPDYQANEPAPAETPAPPAERPRTQQRTTRRTPKPTEETYTPPPVAQPRNDENAARGSEPIVPPSPSRRMDGGAGAPADNSLGSARNTPATPPPPPKPTTALLAEGTVIDVRLDDQLSSATNEVGDTFKAILDRDLIVDGQMLAPKGSQVTGKVSDVAGSGKVKGLARMSLVLTAIKVGEDRYAIDTGDISVQAENTKARDAKTIGAGAAIGAAIGAIAGGKKGAAIGGAVGGGAGTAGVLATKGKQVEFLPEHKFSFRLEKDVTMKIR